MEMSGCTWQLQKYARPKIYVVILIIKKNIISYMYLMKKGLDFEEALYIIFMTRVIKSIILNIFTTDRAQ